MDVLNLVMVTLNLIGFHQKFNVLCRYLDDSLIRRPATKDKVFI